MSEQLASHRIPAVETERLSELVDEISQRIQAGEAVSLDDYAQQFPEYVDQLRQLLPALQAMADLGHSIVQPEDNGERSGPSTEPTAGVLGDFHILREIGRGGMGVVYEAEQLSLKRKVALKVLPFATVLDPRHLQRFKSVGCERGVHHYAMRFIEGQMLSARCRAPPSPG